MLSAMPGSGGKPGARQSIQNVVDVQSLQHGLIPLLVFRRDPDNHNNTHIELFLEKILIASSMFMVHAFSYADFLGYFLPLYQLYITLIC